MKKNTWVFLYIKYSKFWSILMEHFVERKPLISEECSWIFFLTLVEALFDEDNENQPALVRFVPTENENDEIIFDDINVVIEENVQDYHFAINGKSWAVLRWHFPHLVPKIIQRGTMNFSLVFHF